MKKKHDEWYWNWIASILALLIVVIVHEWVPLPWAYAKPVLFSMILTFGAVSIIFGIIFMVYRSKYLKELDEKYKL